MGSPRVAWRDQLIVLADDESFYRPLRPKRGSLSHADASKGSSSIPAATRNYYFQPVNMQTQLQSVWAESNVGSDHGSWYPGSLSFYWKVSKFRMEFVEICYQYSGMPVEKSLIIGVHFVLTIVDSWDYILLENLSILTGIYGNLFQMLWNPLDFILIIGISLC